MKNLDLISEELFNKIRGRFPSVTIGNVDGKVTNVPKDARYFDFDYKEGDTSLGKVSVSVTDESIEVMYSDNFVGEQDELTQQNWYDFLTQKLRSKIPEVRENCAQAITDIHAEYELNFECYYIVFE